MSLSLAKSKREPRPISDAGIRHGIMGIDVEVSHKLIGRRIAQRPLKGNPVSWAVSSTRGYSVCLLPKILVPA